MRAHLRHVMFLLPLGLLAAADSPDFSGTWNLDRQHSNWRGLPTEPADVLNVSRQNLSIFYTESDAKWIVALDGSESKYRVGDSDVNSKSKWEGRALLINTLVSGSQTYVIEDRWELSRNLSVLTITRTVRRGAIAHEATLVYRHKESGMTQLAAAPPPVAAPTQIVIQAGTKIPLSLVNSLNTKRSAAGDRVYLETAFPVTQDGRIIIPKGSYVAGTVTDVKRAGKVKGKAELFLRFDSLTLPNGVTREFRSRLDSADGNDVDRQEGKIRGESNKAGDAKTVGEAAGAGATVGSIAGSIAGHAGMGAGIGVIGGAAAGLMAVLATRGPDLILPKGTTLEMVLDRELHYDASELTLR